MCGRGPLREALSSTQVTRNSFISALAGSTLLIIALHFGVGDVQVELRGAQADVAEEALDRGDGHPGVGHVPPKRVSELVAGDPAERDRPDADHGPRPPRRLARAAPGAGGQSLGTYALERVAGDGLSHRRCQQRQLPDHDDGHHLLFARSFP